ncbi:MAG: GNAT family N-acetyltransferase [Flavobacteriales bacterium]
MIYTASLEDIEEIQQIAHRIWPISYKDIISSQQIEFMLDKMYGVDSLKKQMQDEGCEFLLIKPNERSVGFACYGRNQQGIWRLHKLYVEVDQHGKGLGKQLLQEVCRRVVARGGNELELNVNKYNPALNFYKANGFVLRREEVLDIGNNFVMDDFVLVKSLG